MIDTQNVQVPEDPLELANNGVAAVRAIADQQERDPLMASASGLSRHGAATALLASQLALVSIARDIRRIADHITGGGA